MSRSGIVTISVIIGIVLISAVLVFFVLDRNLDEDSSQNILPEIELPAYTDLDGRPVSLEMYTGKAVVINTWASWCPRCATELKDFEKLAVEYASAGLVVLAINRNEPARTATRFLESIGTFENTIFLLDPTDYFYSSIEGFSMPETVFYDRAGNIVIHKKGFMKLSEMKVYAASALQ